MITNLKIYNAIQRGLNEALTNLSIDDFDDIEIDGTENHDNIETHNGKEEYEKWKYVHDFVDLGLPSGTLWASYNLGAHSPLEVGNYYAWGELTPKSFYSEKTYNPIILTNDKFPLPLKYDAAYQMYKDINPGVHIPTKEQFEELMTLRHGMNIYGSAMNFHGNNGNTLTLPISGFMYEDELYNTSILYYATLNFANIREDYHLLYFFNGDDFNTLYPYLGIPIRPVLEK